MTDLFAAPRDTEGAYIERRCGACGRGPLRWVYVPPATERPRGPGMASCDRCGEVAYGWPRARRFPTQVARRRWRTA